MDERTLYVTDLDGTLLSPDATLSPENASRLSALTARGALISCATARTPGTVQPLMAPAHLSAPAIVMTGAALWTIDSAHPHFEDVRYIAAGEAGCLDAVFAAGGVTPFIYVADPQAPDGVPLHFYHATEQMSDAEYAFADVRSRLALKHFHRGETAPGQHRVLYFAMGPRERIETVAAAIRKRVACSMSCYPDSYTRGLQLLEIFAPGVSKATAVKALQRRVGAGRVVVFGDNLNDLPMMTVADVSVAAPGALAEVKARATVILEPSPTAVADFIARDYAAHGGEVTGRL